MLEYFPNLYWSNLLFSNGASLGAPIGDLDDACRGALQVLRAEKNENSPQFKEALYKGYTEVAAKLDRLAAEDLAAGRTLSASDKSFRAAAVWLCLEGSLDDYYDSRKAAAFDQARAAFKRALQYGGPRHEPSQFIEIPFEGKTFPALFTPANHGGRAPVVIHVNGTHEAIDWQYMIGIVEQLAKRGVASLSMDQPGTGTALYHKGFKLRPNSESYVGAVIDFLGSHPQVDRERIAVCGSSVGGYLAPRATAFEKRIKACVVWGAVMDMPTFWQDRFFGQPSSSTPMPSSSMEARLRQRRWTFGARDNEELRDMIKTWVLPMERIAVPIFIVHGKNDPQMPVSMAEEMLMQAVSSPRAELMIIGPEIGGEMHICLDNPRTAINAISDWVAEVFDAGRPA